MKPASLSIAIDCTSVDATTAAFERKKVAIDAATDALERLGRQEHGGITIRAVGHLVECTVKPAA